MRPKMCVVFEVKLRSCVVVCSVFSLLVYGIFQYAVSFPRFVSKTVVPMDASRQIAGWMGQGVSSLLPPTPEDVAKVLGFPTNKKACQTLARFGAVADGGKVFVSITFQRKIVLSLALGLISNFHSIVH